MSIDRCDMRIKQEEKSVVCVLNDKEDRCGADERHVAGKAERCGTEDVCR